MKITALALSAALVGLASLSSAQAAPVTPAAHSSAQTSAVVDVQYKKKPYKYGHKYRPGGRYKKAPKGWHRHSKRPSYWQTRGCVVVGPVWFCP